MKIKIDNYGLMQFQSITFIYIQINISSVILF